MKRSDWFQRTSKLKSAEIVFSDCILETLLQYCVLLRFVLAFVRSLLPDLDPYGRNDSHGMIPLF